MSKAMVYILSALLLASSALALGIGAKNIQIAPEGQKVIGLFIINDEHQDIEVNIGVLGDETGVKINPSQMSMGSSQYISKFNVNVDFEARTDKNVTIVASESSQNNAQLSAVANVIYRLPLAADEKKTNESKKEVPVKTEQPEKSQPANVSLNETSLSQKTERNPSTEKISGASSSENSLSVDFSLGNSDFGKFAFAIAAILAAITGIDVFFMKRKSPVERYIEKSRKMGKTEDEIRSKLKEAGWSELMIEPFLKK